MESYRPLYDTSDRSKPAIRKVNNLRLVQDFASKGLKFGMDWILIHVVVSLFGVVKLDNEGVGEAVLRGQVNDRTDENTIQRERERVLET